jgi:hypothetical protein
MKNVMIFRACGALALISLATSLVIAPALASEVKVVQRSVTIYTLSDNPKLKEQVTQICLDKSITLSPKARTACDTNAFPLLSKSLQFRNSGIGAEFNTLARQRTEPKA